MLELAATVLLTLAAVATAWASYQSARWHGQQARAQGASIATRLESTRADAVAGVEAQVDVTMFTQWLDAYAGGQRRLADFYRQRFRPEFRPAFAAWIATRPRENPQAPPTPFAMRSYRLATAGTADRLQATSAGYARLVGRDIQRADNYLLAVVLFAAALFFAGISTKLDSRPARSAILAVGYLLFAGTVAWIATFPVTVAL